MSSDTTAGKFRGFTLLEVLVVILIMGLFVGLVGAIVRPDDRGLLRVEAERLGQLLELAAAESRLTGKSIAWSVDGPGYRFGRYQEDSGWSDVPDSELLRRRTLPQGMTVSALQVENAPVNGVMRLEFPPYGLMHAYTIDLSLGVERYAIVASPVGVMQVMQGPGASPLDAAPR